jgi:hypothetical protein
LSIVFALERTNQLSLLPDKDLVDLCPPIEPYQVTKSQNQKLLLGLGVSPDATSYTAKHENILILNLVIKNGLFIPPFA